MHKTRESLDKQQKQLRIPGVVKQSEQLFCSKCGNKLELIVETDLNSGRTCKSRLCTQSFIQCAFVFDCRDTRGRKAQIFIEAENRESAIAIFESDYEDYKWWQTNEYHF